MRAVREGRSPSEAGSLEEQTPTAGPTPVCVVDYGVGNLASLKRALERAGARVTVVDRPQALARTQCVVLPGVGAFAAAADRLAHTGLGEAVQAAVGRGAWLLGVCLGMQLLFARSAEGPESRGLGLLPGEVEQLFTAGRAPVDGSTGARLKVPHMGWNKVVAGAAGGAMFAGLDGAYFYFAHSYAVRTPAASLVAGVTRYGGDVVAAVARHTVWGVQFHPEKSSTAGELLLRNFLRAARADGQREGRA